MNSLISNLTQFGAYSLLNFWYPMILWSSISVIVLLILRLSKNIHHSLHYSIRIAILYSLPIGLLMIPFVSFSLIQPESTELISTVIYVPEKQNTEVKRVHVSETSQPSLTKDFWIGLLSAAAIGIGFFRFIYFFSQYVGLHRFRTFLPQIEDKDILGHIADISVVMQIERKISVYSASDRNVPMTFGYWRPVIIVPGNLLENKSRLVAALTHECIHIANNDYVFKLWEEIFHNLFFFNPLVGLLTDQIEKYREISCDSEVISKDIIVKADYAKLLVEMTQIDLKGKQFSLGITYSNIKERILAIQNQKQFIVSVPVKILSFSLFFSMLLGLTFVIACTNMTPVESYNSKLDGVWYGKMIQPEGSRGLDGYDMEISLSHNDTMVFGKSRIYIEGTEYYGVMNLTGKFKNDSLYFEETSFLENKPRPNLFWCLKKGVLVFNGNKSTLSGQWSNDVCTPGSIYVVKSDNITKVDFKSGVNFSQNASFKPGFVMINPKIVVNGKQIGLLSGLSRPGTSVISSSFQYFFAGIKEIGWVVIHDQPFENAVESGKISEKKLEFKLEGNTVSLVSDEKILPGKNETVIWVKSVGDYSGTEPLLGVTSQLDKLNEIIKSSNEYSGSLKYKNPESGEILASIDTPPEVIGGYAELLKNLKYPEEAKKDSIEGIVLLRATINKDGEIVQMEAVKSPNIFLTKSAMDAIKDVKFTSPVNDGKKVSTWITIPIKFKLKQREN